MLEIPQKYRKRLAEYRFIDLFAGLGGFRLALQSYGAKCVFSSEWETEVSKIYKANFDELPAGDITKIKEGEIPKHDILCAGFPCQAFSISGKQLGFQEARGTLFFDIARIADYHKPKLLILENVKNFAKHDKGKTLHKVEEILDEIGYSVHHKILNAGNFGVPQKRERIYIVCFRKDLDTKEFVFPKSLELKTKLLNILERNGVTEKYITKRTDIQLKREILIDIDLEGNSPQKPIRVGIVNKGGQGERIYHPEGHAITLSAYGGGAGAKTGLYLIDGKIRKLTPRECARLTGLPDDYIIHSNDNKAYMQFGNSVVVNVLQSIILEILKQKLL